MIDAIDQVKSIGAGGVSSPFSDVFQTMQSHELRMRDRLETGLRPNQNNFELNKFLDDTFQRLQTKYTTPIEAQSFQLVREQAVASQSANVEHVRSKIESKLNQIQMELGMKAMSKTSQGLQQLLSSQ